MYLTEWYNQMKQVNHELHTNENDIKKIKIR